MTTPTTAAIYTPYGDILSQGLQTATVCDQAIQCARRAARDRGVPVVLDDSDGVWLVQPAGSVAQLDREAWRAGEVRRLDRVAPVATYGVTIRLEIVAPNADAAELAVEGVLDAGTLQDAINGYSEACDEGDIEVASCTFSSASGRPVLRRCEACSGAGPCLWDRRTGRYSCRDCHSEPDDPFFTRDQDDA